MAEITRITINGESGYCHYGNAYSDKLSATEDSICYERKPMEETEFNMYQKWSYKTTSPVFKELFRQLAESVNEILSRDLIPDVLDAGAITFTVTYSDKTRESITFFALPDDFKECFAVAKLMVPGCESTPSVLETSEDCD